MKIAEVLSDLTSLRVCDHSAALALVSARPAPSSAAASNADNAPSAEADRDNDPDLTRAKDLVELHYSVKVANQIGFDRELVKAREDVRRAVTGLG